MKRMNHCLPLGWWVTPLNVEDPLEKPWDWRRTAIISSSMLMLCIQHVKSLYLHYHACSWELRICWRWLFGFRNTVPNDKKILRPSETWRPFMPYSGRFCDISDACSEGFQSSCAQSHYAVHLFKAIPPGNWSHTSQISIVYIAVPESHISLSGLEFPSNKGLLASKY